MSHVKSSPASVKLKLEALFHWFTFATSGVERGKHALPFFRYEVGFESGVVR